MAAKEVKKYSGAVKLVPSKLTDCDGDLYMQRHLHHERRTNKQSLDQFLYNLLLFNLNDIHLWI